MFKISCMLQYIFQYICIPVYVNVGLSCLSSVDLVERNKQSMESTRIGILKQLSAYWLKTSQFGK